MCDRIAVWQKALNVAIEEGVKIENHSKLMKMVREWREQAKRNEIEGLEVQPWERRLISIFEDDTIKEEVMDTTDNDEQDSKYQSNIRSASAKQLSEHELVPRDEQLLQYAAWPALPDLQYGAGQRPPPSPRRRQDELV